MKGRLEEFIDKHSEELDHRTPNPEVLNRIMQQMGHSAPVNKQPKSGIVISFSTMRWAAAACVVLALGVGLWKINTHTETEESLAHTARKPQPQHVVRDTVPAATTELAKTSPQVNTHRFDEIDRDIALRKNQIAGNLQHGANANYKKVLFDKLNNDASPAGRIRALTQTNKLHSMSNDVVDVLVETMNNDPNTNVRLAALDGLAKFYKEKYVRKQLVKSLKKQHDPMVQIELIGLLTRLKESAILSQLESMVADENSIPAVRETAYTGIFELKGS